MSDDRRAAPRHPIELDAEIDLGNGPIRTAITRDGSERGVLLLTNEEIEVGQHVTLSCRVDHTLVTAVGTVVRKQPNHDGSFHTSVAIELAAKNPLVAEIFRQLARKSSQPPSA
jgi:hypothetical protein